MPSSVPPPELGSGLSDALPWLSAAVTGLVGWSAARFTAFAQLNKTILDASRQMVADAQEVHARDGARILELEAEIIRQRGAINQGLQREQSMQHLIDRLRAEIDSRP